MSLGKEADGRGTSDKGRIPVVIAADGAAVIDGVPVPMAAGKAVDAAILDALHGHARKRNTPVTAAISDPSAEYVAIVEVSPDGSSRLVEQQPTPPPAMPSAPTKPRRQSDYEYQPPGLLKRPLIVGTAGVVMALLIVIPLIVSGTGSDGDDTRDQAAGSVRSTDEAPEVPVPLPRDVTTSPSPTAEPTPTASGASGSPSPTKTPSAKPSPKPSATKKDGEGVPEPTKTPKPHKETAAEAVSKLAASSPGRHICYRVYFAKDGWQKPACDGVTAGRVNATQKIKSLNIAVSGTKGTAANAYVHNDHWKTPWNSAVDGVDNYIGSTKAGYPYMLGFVINVGDGAVCENAAVSGHGWVGLACDKPEGQAEGNYVTGGTMDDTLWLTAVRFTV